MTLMMEEIQEQPAVLERILQLEQANVKRFRRLAQRRDFRLVVLVARGTSDNAALFGRYLIEVAAGLPASLAAPSVHTLYRARVDLRRALVVGISQSGEGLDVNRVLEASRKHGAFTVGITNQPRSTMASLVDELFLVRAGLERSVAATKTYTGQLLLLYQLAWALGAPLGQQHIQRLPALAARALRIEPEVRELVSRYSSMERCLVVARGLNYSTAFEFALKLMETCYVVAERFSSADLLHGPIAMVGRGFPVFAFMPPGVTRAAMDKVTLRLAQMGAHIMAFTSYGRRIRVETALVLLCRIPELWTPIPYVIPAQLFAALLAEAKGLNPDNPRYLRKITRTF